MSNFKRSCFDLKFRIADCLNMVHVLSHALRNVKTCYWIFPVLYCVCFYLMIIINFYL